MFSLKKNLNDWARVGRIVMAVVLINLGIAFEGTLGFTLGLIALFPLFIGLTGWCPINALLIRLQGTGSATVGTVHVNKSA